MREEKSLDMKDLIAFHMIMLLIEEFYEKIPINKKKVNADRFREKIKDLIDTYNIDFSHCNKRFIKLLNQLQIKLKKEIFPKIYNIFGGHGGIIINDIGYCEFDSPLFALNKLKQKMELAKSLNMPFNIEIAISCFKWLNINYPDEFETFKTLFKEGRFEIINPSFSQPYSLTIGEESNIKQFEFGLKILNDLELKCNMYYASESSLHPQIPQILIGVGIDYCSLRARLLGINPTTPSGHIIWRGLDNSLIKAITDQPGIFNGETWHGNFFGELPHLMLQAVSRPYMNNIIFSSIEDFVMSLPYNEQVWRLSRFKDLFGKFVLCSELFQIIDLDGEYSFSRDLFYIGDKALNQSELFLNNKRCENLILSVERLNCILNHYQKTSRDEEIEELWEKLLITQAHDNYVVPYIRNGDYSEIQLSTNELKNLKLNENKTPISKLSISLLQEIQEKCLGIIYEDLQKLASYYQNDDYLRHFFIINLAPYQKKDLVSIHLDNILDGKFYLEEPGGRPIRFEIENSNLIFLAHLEPLGYKIYSLKRIENEIKIADTIPNFVYNLSISNDKRSIIIDYDKQPFCSLEFNSKYQYKLELSQVIKNSNQKENSINGTINNKKFTLKISQTPNSQILRFKMESILLDEIKINPKMNIYHTYMNYPFGIEETKRNLFQSLDFVWLMGKEKGLMFIQSNAQKFGIDRKSFTLTNILTDGLFEFALVSTKNEPIAKAYEYIDCYFNKLYGIEIGGINPQIRRSDSFIKSSNMVRITNLWSRLSKSYVRLLNPSKAKIDLKLEGILLKEKIQEVSLTNDSIKDNSSAKLMIEPWKIKTYKL